MEDRIGEIRQNVAGCVGSNIRRANRAVSQFYDDVLRPSGLRITQFSLLARVMELQPVTINDLAEAALMDRTTLGRNLKPLEKQGLVRIAPGPDRRTRLVRPTAEGGAALARTLPLWQKAQAHMRNELGADRADRLISDLREAIAVTRAD